MNRTKEEYLALLEDTVKYYSEDTSRRAMEENDCVYLTEDGRKCAVGRFLVENFDYTHFNSCYSVKDLYTQYGNTDKFLTSECRGYNIDFWQRLQGLHDNSTLWDNKGLTKSGKITVENIKSHIESGYYVG